MTRTFVPFVNTDNLNDRVFVRAPRLPTTSLDDPHFGMSFLFTKLSPAITVYNLRAVLSATIEFFSYDGNNGVLFTKDDSFFTPFDPRR